MYKTRFFSFKLFDLYSNFLRPFYIIHVPQSCYCLLKIIACWALQEQHKNKLTDCHGKRSFAEFRKRTETIPLFKLKPLC